jgi:hypothetical protein
MLGLSGEQHPAKPRIERQPGELSPTGGQLPCFIHCAELLQELIAGFHIAAVRRINERKVLDLAKVQ